MSQLFNLDELPPHSIDIGHLKVLSGDKVMVFWADVEADTHTPRHSHPNEQISWVVEGSIRYRIGDGPVTECGPGSVLVIPGDTPHESWYLEKCKIVEVHSPPRFELFPLAREGR